MSISALRHASAAPQDVKGYRPMYIYPNIITLYHKCTNNLSLTRCRCRVFETKYICTCHLIFSVSYRSSKFRLSVIISANGCKCKCGPSLEVNYSRFECPTQPDPQALDIPAAPYINCCNFEMKSSYARMRLRPVPISNPTRRTHSF